MTTSGYSSPLDQADPGYVRYWHEADIPPYAQYVSFHPKQNVEPERRRPRRGRITGL